MKTLNGDLFHGFIPTAQELTQFMGGNNLIMCLEGRLWSFYELNVFYSENIALYCNNPVVSKGKYQCLVYVKNIFSSDILRYFAAFKRYGFSQSIHTLIYKRNQNHKSRFYMRVHTVDDPRHGPSLLYQEGRKVCKSFPPFVRLTRPSWRLNQGGVASLVRSIDPDG